jgi:Tol biopolymer transport system component/DNA-binding winged helix-turn-helix (wHTH) protein
MAVKQQILRKIYCFDEFQIDARKQVLLRQGKPVPLNAKTFTLLLALVSSDGRDLSKEELMQTIWQDQIVEENNLAVHIYNLRKILDERKDEPRYIITVPGVGYRFIAEVTELPAEPEELFIESRTLSRIIVEEDPATDYPHPVGHLNEEVHNSLNTSPAPTSRAVTSLSQSINRKAIWLGMLAAGLTFAAGLGSYWFFRSLSQSADTPTGELSTRRALTRITNDGHIAAATISPDGKYAAYVLNENNGRSLRLRQIGTASDIRVLPPTKADFWGLTFSPDGRYIYYSLFTSDKVDIDLFRVPTLGGVSEKIPNVSASGIAFSPDGNAIAFIQTDSASGMNSLVIARPDGSNPRIVASKPYPNSFYQGEHVAWSANGKMIACLVNQIERESAYFTVVSIDARDGTEQPISNRRWYEAGDIQWYKDGWLVTAKDNPSAPTTQIWRLPIPAGEAHLLINDLNHYSWVSVTPNGESLIAIQTNTINAISVGEVGAKDFQEIVSEVGDLKPVIWTVDGKIVFRSSKDGGANLWLTNADGSGRRQLTLNAQVDSRGLTASPDGKYIVFVSWRSGKLNLWRIDASGDNLVQLTDGDGDAYPRCTPDGSAVIFQRGILTKPMLWRVPLNGGAAEPLTGFRAKWAALSTDGNQLAYLQMANEKWHIGISPSSGGVALRAVDTPDDLRESTIQWSPDNRALLYISGSGDVGNVRALPLDGGGSKSLTSFTSHWLADFCLSPDGKRLVVMRSLSISDLVLIDSLALP